MEPFQYHVYVCTQHKPDGAPCCSANGALETLQALRRALAEQGLADAVQVTTCGSLGLCDRGPNMIVYPEGVWYSDVRPKDVEELVREHFGKGRVVERLISGGQAALRAKIDENKRRMLAALKAREEAGVLPDDLQQSINGFRDSRVLLTAVELDVFTALGKRADGIEVAGKLGTEPRAIELLLNALVGLGLLTKHDGKFANTPTSARYLVAGARDDSRAAIMHTVYLWPAWSTLTECIKKGTSVTTRETGRGDEAWTEAFIAAMQKNATLRAPTVARAVGLDGVRRILDVGGGSGAYSIAFARAKKDLTADILDVERVVPIALRHIHVAGLSDRVKARVGDLYSDNYGSDYDLVLLSAICHMLSPEENRAVLAKAYAALAPSGRVVIQDFILFPDKTGPKIGVLFAINMLVGTRAGNSYSEQEYTSWLRDAGFKDIRRQPLPGPTDLLISRRP